MRKGFFIFLTVTIALVASVYVFIPNQLQISQTVTIHTPESVIDKFLVRERGWDKWWPDQKNIAYTPPHNFYWYSGTSFRFSKSTLSTVDLEITRGNFEIPASLDFVVDSTGNIQAGWHATVFTGFNPLIRFRRYQQAKTVHEHVGNILRHVKAFLENDKNIYGIKIRYDKVKDSLVLQTKIVLKTYPTTGEIYALIGELRKAIALNKVKANDFPMLNITQLEDRSYQVMVGIPISKRIPVKGNLAIKEMVLGNILVTEVRGGNQTVENGLKQMENFMSDHRHTSPAIPFASLVTDRMAEPDTSTWVTRIYYPIY